MRSGGFELEVLNENRISNSRIPPINPLILPFPPLRHPE